MGPPNSRPVGSADRWARRLTITGAGLLLMTGRGGAQGPTEGRGFHQEGVKRNCEARAASRAGSQGAAWVHAGHRQAGLAGAMGGTQRKELRSGLALSIGSPIATGPWARASAVNIVSSALNLVRSMRGSPPEPGCLPIAQAHSASPRAQPCCWGRCLSPVGFTSYSHGSLPLGSAQGGKGGRELDLRSLILEVQEGSLWGLALGGSCPG